MRSSKVASGVVNYGDLCHAPRLRAALRESFKWVKSEQQLPGAFRKEAKESKAGYFGWSGTGSFGFNPLQRTYLNYYYYYYYY